MKDGKDYKKLALNEVILVSHGAMTQEQAYGLSRATHLPVILVPDWSTVETASLDDLQRIIDREREKRNATTTTQDNQGEAILQHPPVAD